jgi:hypothetical protein
LVTTGEFVRCIDDTILTDASEEEALEDKQKLTDTAN